MPWLPGGSQHPAGLSLPTGHHLRPIREDDAELDYPAVMGSRQRLWDIYGEAWGWPPATMTFEQDRIELAWHAQEMRDGSSFNFAILGPKESELVGCVYIDPPRPIDDADAVVSWWVVDNQVGGELDVALAQLVPHWLTTEWGFARVRYGVFPAG